MAETKSEPRQRAVSETTSKILGVKTYVLDDGRVVVTATHFEEAFGQRRYGTSSSEPGGAGVPRFLTSKGLKSFVAAGLAEALVSPITFTPLQGGRDGYGYDPDTVVDVAQAIMDAEAAGALRPEQAATAAAARAIVKAAAKVGLKVALLDEHGMQPRAGAADEMRGKVLAEVEGLRRELEEERAARIKATLQGEVLVNETRAALATTQTSLTRTEVALCAQVKGNARMAEKIATLEEQVAMGAASSIRKEVCDWLRARLEEIACLRVWGRTDITLNQARGDVHDQLRICLGYFTPWEDMPVAQMTFVKVFLRRMHKHSLTDAKRRGYDGKGTWTQPPLPYLGIDEDDSQEAA